MTAVAPAINARAILATLDRRYDLGGVGDASPCNSAVPYVLEVILVCLSYGVPRRCDVLLCLSNASVLQAASSLHPARKPHN